MVRVGAGPAAVAHGVPRTAPHRLPGIVDTFDDYQAFVRLYRQKGLDKAA